MNYLFKLLKPKSRPDVNYNFDIKRIFNFAYMFIAQQFVFLIYSIFAGFKLSIVGLISSVIISLLIIRYIYSFKSIQESIIDTNKIKHPVKIIRNRILLIFGISILYNAIGNILIKNQINNISGNQEAINTYFQKPMTTVLIIIMTIVVAPHIEEFCFRYIIIGKNTNQFSMKTKFIFAGIVFSFAHVATQLPDVFSHKLQLITWLFYLGQYAVIGLIFSQCYAKYQNYRLNVYLHSSWNTFTVLTTLISLYLQQH